MSLRIRIGIAESRNRVVKVFLRGHSRRGRKVLANGETTHVICGSNAGRNYCQKITTVCSAPSSRPAGPERRHVRRAQRQRPDIFAALRCRFGAEIGFAGAGGDRENECVARGGGAPGGVGTTAYGTTRDSENLLPCAFSAEQVRQLQGKSGALACFAAWAQHSAKRRRAR